MSTYGVGRIIPFKFYNTYVYSDILKYAPVA